MSAIVTIKLDNNKEFKLSCSKDNKKQLELIAKKLDDEIGYTRQDNPSASFELALLITSLRLMYEKLSKFQEGSGSSLELLQTTGSDLESAHSDLQKLLSLMESELKIIANKLEKC